MNKNNTQCKHKPIDTIRRINENKRGRCNIIHVQE